MRGQSGESVLLRAGKLGCPPFGHHRLPRLVTTGSPVWSPPAPRRNPFKCALPVHSKQRGSALARPSLIVTRCGTNTYFNAPGGARTPSLLIRSQMLYPLSYER